MTSNILVTGATGTVGRTLVERLQGQGARVFAGSRSGRDVAGAPGRLVDFEQPATLDAAFAGVDALFLLFPLQPNKLQLAGAAVDAARRAGVAHLVRSSGAGADPASPYAINRLQGQIDDVITRSGLACTLLRPNSFMQNWVNYYGAMVRAGSVYLASGAGRSAWIDARDIADAAAAVLLDPAPHAGRSYELTGPGSYSAAEVLEVIRAETGVAATHVPISPEQAAQNMSAMGMDPWTVDIMVSLARMIADGLTASTSADVPTLTGRPARTLSAYARENADHWR